MKAIVFDKFGPPEVLFFKDVPVPEPEAGYVKIQIKAFGLNHAESHMRKGEWDEYNPILGVECVGIVSACPGGEFAVGSRVAAVMGGLSRTLPGSYAEYTNAKASNVMPIESSLPWEQLAALPIAYVTIWSCLFTVLDVRRGETLLIRGATSTLGAAAVNLAVNAGATVVATTRRRERFPQLEAMGVHAAEMEGPDLVPKFQLQKDGTDPRFDKVLNLVGNSVLLDTLTVTKRGGRCLQAGWLGGLAPIAEFQPMLQMACGVHFSLFHSGVVGGPDFPLSEVPLQDIVRKLEEGKWSAKPSHVYDFDDIHEAHRMLDSGEANGKLVVRL